MSHRRPVSRADDLRPLVAVDWSARGIHVTFDGDAVAALPDTEALLTLLHEPHQIVVEATFESFDPARRRQLLDQVRAAGHEVYGYRPKHTAYNRPDDWAKTDANDARVIHALAVDGRLNMYPLPDPAPSWVAFREHVCEQYLDLRLTGCKDDLAAAAAEILGPYRALDADARQALGNGKAYSTSALAALYVAAWHTRGREQFERLVGMHASGYPSVLRSDLHHHHVRHRFNKQVPWQVLRRQLRCARTLLAAAFADGRGIDPAVLLATGPTTSRQNTGAAADPVWSTLTEDTTPTAPVPDIEQLWKLLANVGSCTTSELTQAAGLAPVQAPAVQMRLVTLARARRAKRTGKEPNFRWHALGVPETPDADLPPTDATPDSAPPGQPGLFDG